MDATTEKAQIRITRSSASYWRVTFDNPPLNVIGPQFVREFREIVTAAEADEEVKVLVFESAVEEFVAYEIKLHLDFLAAGGERSSGIHRMSVCGPSGQSARRSQRLLMTPFETLVGHCTKYAWTHTRPIQVC